MIRVVGPVKPSTGSERLRRSLKGGGFGAVVSVSTHVLILTVLTWFLIDTDSLAPEEPLDLRWLTAREVELVRDREREVGRAETHGRHAVWAEVLCRGHGEEGAHTAAMHVELPGHALLFQDRLQVLAGPVQMPHPRVGLAQAQARN
ncbi:MAG: hypothetical protein MK004_05285, partial [Planctomycetales bacterium]|nr:hypothetical protein [Planctomycetales bacterium]